MKHTGLMTIGSELPRVLDAEAPGENGLELVRRRPPGPRSDLHILLLVNGPQEADPIRAALNDPSLNISIAEVATREAFLQELAHHPPQLILSDFSVPGLEGVVAMEMARRALPLVPFIFVTGVLGEEVAIDLVKRGATDFVLKTHLARLLPVVKRALLEAQERRERRRAEERLRNSHEQLRALNSHLERVREEERARIAREVHDELGQSLTGLKLGLAWLARTLPRGARPWLRKIREMSAQIDLTIHSLRRIATELRPGILDSLGLVAAIEWQAKAFQEQSGIACEVKIELEDTALGPDLTTVCFRIYQETLTNIIRHAHATNVDVSLADADGMLVLTVRDNGRGIAEREIFDVASIGLIGMRERAAQVGGEIFFFGLPGHGTTVTLRAPLPSGAVAHAAP